MILTIVSFMFKIVIMKPYSIKYFTSAVLLITCCVAISGCSGFLEEQDPSNLSQESFFSIPEHAESAIAAVYADTRFIGDAAGSFSANWQLLEALTGTSTTESAENASLNNLYSLVHDGNNRHIVNWWNGLYRVIAQANLVIANVPNISPMDEALRAKIMGEAYFLRAWAYFYAVRLWGDIPLITSPQNASSEDFFPSRAPKEAVYDLIVSDLTAAESAGLPWMDSSGRASLAAVKSQLAIVYLTMAGHPLDKGSEYYRLAAEKSGEVIAYSTSNPGELNLFANYSAFRDPSLKNVTEQIFMVQFHGSIVQNLQGLYTRPNFKPVSITNTGVGTTVPTVSFYNSFDNDDVRKQNRVGFFYKDYYTNGSGSLFSLGGPYIFKFFNTIANGSPGKAGTGIDDLNIHQTRFAEILLTYAEARNELGELTDEAYNALKKIRDRAHLETPAKALFTKETFRDAVWKERWHELCYEGITWFDMVRLRKVFNEQTGAFDDFVGHVNLSSNQALKEQHLLLPLPALEMLDNPNLTPQNPGYN